MDADNVFAFRASFGRHQDTYMVILDSSSNVSLAYPGRLWALAICELGLLTCTPRRQPHLDCSRATMLAQVTRWFSRARVAKPITRDRWRQNMSAAEWDNGFAHEHELRYRPVNAVIDLDVTQLWRRQCRDSHGDCCNDRYLEPLAQHLEGLLQIDTEDSCLVTRTSDTLFVALSYVWVDAPAFETTISNLEGFSNLNSVPEGHQFRSSRHDS